MAHCRQCGKPLRDHSLYELRLCDRQMQEAPERQLIDRLRPTPKAATGEAVD